MHTNRYGASEMPVVMVTDRQSTQHSIFYLPTVRTTLILYTTYVAE